MKALMRQTAYVWKMVRVETILSYNAFVVLAVNW